MGMYTELVLGIKLKLQEHENYVLDILKYMCGDVEELTVPEDKLTHPLFETERWRFMFRCGSYYFDGQTNSFVTEDDIGCKFLTVRCNLKNYNSEIEEFLDWIVKYTDYFGEFVGYMRYEEDDLPTLIYFNRDDVKYGYPTEITLYKFDKAIGTLPINM